MDKKKIKEAAHKYYLSHREQCLTKNKKYNAAHKEEAKLYPSNSPARKLARNRKWRKDHWFQSKLLDIKRYRKHKYELLESAHRYYKRHKTHILIRSHLYYMAHKEELNAKAREKRRMNKIKRRKQ
jgi:hypothetical protein